MSKDTEEIADQIQEQLKELSEGKQEAAAELLTDTGETAWK